MQHSMRPADSISAERQMMKISERGRAGPLVSRRPRG
jgi:hypothetical protein